MRHHAASGCTIAFALQYAAVIALFVFSGCASTDQFFLPAQSVLPHSWEFAQQLPASVGARGMVASDASLATDAGVGVLRRGGNAVDAAVATAFALAVVMPEAGNLGGGGFLVLRMHDGTTAALDFREKAPLAARRDMYLNAAGTPTEASITGHLAAGVPGTVAGLYAAHERFGRLRWSQVLEPAIRLAHDGFPVTSDLADAVKGDSTRLSRFPASAALFLPGGHPLQAGTILKNPDLGNALQRIADSGPEGFYAGRTAALIEAEMLLGNGLISQEDLRSYDAVWRTPVAVHYRNHTILSMPPPSSGGLSIALIANMLEAYDLAGLGWHSPQAIHVAVEAMRRAFADRNHFLGDPDVVMIPQEQLASKSYAAMRRASIRPDRATPSADVSHGGQFQYREGMDITAAVDAPRFHHQHLPDRIVLEESGFTPDAVESLHRLGHATNPVHALSMAPSILRKNGTWRGRSDPRLHGSAAGY